MTFTIPVLFGTLGTAVATIAAEVISAKTVAIAGTVVGAVVATSRVSYCQKKSADCMRRDLEQALEEAMRMAVRKVSAKLLRNFIGWLLRMGTVKVCGVKGNTGVVV